MRALVLGGTGAMGYHLVSLLANDGFEVVVTSRSRRGSDQERVSYAEGNAHDMEFLRETLSKPWDVIIDFMTYSVAGFTDRVDLLLDATSQYVFLSSSRVYAESKQRITEASPRLLDTCLDKVFLATEDYALAKARQEDILIRSERRNWTIVRPYITYGEERLQFGVLEKEGWLFRALNGKTIVFSMDMIKKETTLTYGLDVSVGIKSIIGRPQSMGEIFNISSQESLLWEDVLKIYMDVLKISRGCEPKILLLNPDDFDKCHSSTYQVAYDRKFDRKFDSRKIGQYVNLEDFSSAEIGLRNCLQGFLENPRFRDINWKFEALKDRLAGDRMPILRIPGFRQKLKYIFFRYF